MQPGGSRVLALRFAVVVSLALPVSPFANPRPPCGATSPDDPQPTMHLVWFGSHELFPRVAVDPMGAQITRLFARYGISVLVHDASKVALETVPDPKVVVILTPTEPGGWGLESHVMAAAVGGPKRGHSIFVFFPSVMRTLGAPATDRRFTESARSFTEVTRGVGRVVAHELVHVLAPGRGHAEQGLMSRRLGRKILVGRENVALDPVSREQAVVTLRDWFERERRLVQRADAEAAPADAIEPALTRPTVLTLSPFGPSNLI